MEMMIVKQATKDLIPFTLVAVICSFLMFKDIFESRDNIDVATDNYEFICGKTLNKGTVRYRIKLQEGPQLYTYRRITPKKCDQLSNSGLNLSAEYDPYTFFLDELKIGKTQVINRYSNIAAIAAIWFMLWCGLGLDYLRKTRKRKKDKKGDAIISPKR